MKLMGREPTEEMRRVFHDTIREYCDGHCLGPKSSCGCARIAARAMIDATPTEATDLVRRVLNATRSWWARKWAEPRAPEDVDLVGALEEALDHPEIRAWLEGDDG